MTRRLVDSILQGAQGIGHAPMLDPRYGGQMGWSPNLREIVNHQAYVSKQANVLLIDAPLGFQLLPDGQALVASLKEMFETHAQSWTGLDQGLEADFVEKAVGGAGEMHESVSKVRRIRTQPVWGGIDLYGRPFQTLYEVWMEMLMEQPDTGYPGIVTLGAGATDMLMDISGATVLFYETDPSNTSIAKATLTTGMMPRTTGDIRMTRDKRQGGEQSELSIGFTGVSVSNYGVRLFAQQLHNQINFANANPNLRVAPVDGIDPDVDAVGRGLRGGVEELGATSILQV